MHDNSVNSAIYIGNLFQNYIQLCSKYVLHALLNRRVKLNFTLFQLVYVFKGVFRYSPSVQDILQPYSNLQKK